MDLAFVNLLERQTLPCTELHIRGGIEDNSKIMFLIKENRCCDPSLEPSWHDGSNDGSQNRFLWRKMANYPQIIPVTPSYQEHCI